MSTSAAVSGWSESFAAGSLTDRGGGHQTFDCPRQVDRCACVCGLGRPFLPAYLGLSQLACRITAGGELAQHFPPRINRRFPTPPAPQPAAADPSCHGAVTHQTAGIFPAELRRAFVADIAGRCRRIGTLD